MCIFYIACCILGKVYTFFAFLSSLENVFMSLNVVNSLPHTCVLYALYFDKNYSLFYRSTSSKISLKNEHTKWVSYTWIFKENGKLVTNSEYLLCRYGNMPRNYYHVNLVVSVHDLTIFKDKKTLLTSVNIRVIWYFDVCVFSPKLSYYISNVSHNT